MPPLAQVNAATARWEAEQQKKKGLKRWGPPANFYALSRFEFIEALVRIAIRKHVLSGRLRDVSDALERMLFDNILPSVPFECVELKREFLDKCCYNWEVTDTLEKHEELLRLLYATYSSSPSDGGGRFTSMMNLTEWLNFCSDLVPPAPEKFSLRQQKAAPLSFGQRSEHLQNDRAHQLLDLAQVQRKSHCTLLHAPQTFAQVRRKSRCTCELLLHAPQTTAALDGPSPAPVRNRAASGCVPMCAPPPKKKNIRVGVLPPQPHARGEPFFID